MEFSEREITRPDGRVVAWTEWGRTGGATVLRLPGTPGCRWSVPQNTATWEARGLRVLTSERPGFGRSTRLPGRGFVEHSDDLEALLDDAGVASAYLIGPSGAAPHVLAFCQRHPDRVAAATIIVGSAPMTDDEAGGMLAINQRGRELARSADRDALAEFLSELRDSILHDAAEAFGGMMSDAPIEDREALADPEAQRTLTVSLGEALAGGVDGWVDETIALLGDWADIDPERVTTPITWYHGRGDRNCPFTAAVRLVDRIPNGQLIEWPNDAGHLHAQHHDAAILDELLAHNRPVPPAPT